MLSFHVLLTFWSIKLLDCVWSLSNCGLGWGFFLSLNKIPSVFELRRWIGRICFLKANKAFFFLLMAKALKSGTWLWYVILIRCCIFRLVNQSLFKQICSMISWELHFRNVWNQNISTSISVHTTEIHSPANGVLFKAWRFQIFVVPKNQWVDFL